MKIKKKTIERIDRSGKAPFKSLFVELNGQLQTYIAALKNTSPEPR